MAEIPAPSPPCGRSRVGKLLLFCGIAVVLLMVGVFLVRREIGGLLARELDQRLSAEGIFVTWQSADWTPGAGVSVNGLALYRDQMKRERLVLLSHVILSRENSNWDRGDIVNARATGARLTLSSAETETNLERLYAKLQIRPGRVDLSDGRCILQGLRIEAKGTHLRPTAPGNAPDPAVSKSATPGKGLFEDVDLGWLKTAREWADFQSKEDDPVLTLEFKPRSSGTGQELAAALKGRKFRWRGANWDFVEARLKASEVKDKASMEISQFHAGYGGRTAEMTGDIDPAGMMLRISNLESGVDVLALARALFPKAMAGLSDFNSAGAWRVSGKGQVPLNSPENIRWNGRLELKGDLVHTTRQSRLAFQNPVCSLKVEKATASITALKAGLWEGDLNVPTARLYPATGKDKPQFDAKITIDGARLESVMRSFGKTDKQPGVVQIDWSGGGGFDLATLTGTGRASLRDAEFFRIPVVGSLFRVIDKMTPGFGRDTSTRGEVAHRTAKGRLYLENLVLDSQQVHIELDGAIDMKRETAEFTGYSRVKGLVGVVTSPLSARSEVEGKGPLGDIQWDQDRIAGAGIISGAIRSIGKDDDDDEKKQADKPDAERPKTRKLPPHK